MRPPPDEVLEIQAARYRAMSAERKLEVAFELRALAWRLALAGVRRRRPDLGEVEAEAQVRALFRDAVT